jgi:hypothetical protein
MVIGERGEGAADALDVGVAAGGVSNRALANDVVNEDQAPGLGQAQRPGQVVGRRWLVRVNEDQVKGAEFLCGKLGEGGQGGANADFNGRLQPCPLDVGAGDGGVGGVDLEGDQPAAGGQQIVL